MAVDFSPTPSRYKPVVTYGLLAISFLFTLIAMLAGAEKLSGLTLSYKDGMQPLQWLFSTFIHLDMIQFVGSAAFIAAFGLMVEGRIGPGPFLIFFLLIAISANAVEQVVMQGSSASSEEVDDGPEIQLKDRDTPLTAEEKKILADRAAKLYSTEGSSFKISIGASSAIFGLIAIFLLIEPGSQIRFGSQGEGIQVPLIALVVLFVVWEAGKWFLGGLKPGGLPVHLIGAVPGLAVGGLVKSTGMASAGGKVTADAGESDRGGSGPTAEVKKPKTAAERKAEAARQRQAVKEAQLAKEELLRDSAHMRQQRPVSSKPKVVDPVVKEADEAIVGGKYGKALKMIQGVTEPASLAGISLENYSLLYKAIAKQKQWPAAVLALEKSLEAHADEDVERRLQLGRILIAMKDQERCQAVLAKIQRNELTPEQTTAYRQMVVKLRQLE